MIRGVHAMFYSSKPVELRAFFRDKLRLPFTDVHDGWLIFDLPEGDLGVHPTDPGGEGAPDGTHDISFYCDDVEATVAELTERGVELAGPIQDAGYGLITYLVAPGDLKIQLYQPKYVKGRSR